MRSWMERRENAVGKKRKKKPRQVRKYTDDGHRIASLGRQADLAKVLGVSQQTVSKKLRGEAGIFLRDLRKLAKKFRKPVCFLVMSPDECALVRAKAR